ncbi:MAG: omptin family outer membrane protease [Treponema sp.]|jgi:outer membrane protease|nr:omptin family outer membrane protease [Treponema sp.]
MKSITVLPLFVCLILCPPLEAESVSFPYALSLSPQFGFLYGRGEEQVYRNESSDKLLSQLFWDHKPLVYGGIKLEFAQRNPLAGLGVFSNLSIKFGIPMESGIMEDRDWMNMTGELTHYSRHDAHSKGALILDLAAGPSIPAGPFLAFRPSLGLSYTRFSWTSRDGYKVYYGVYSPVSGTVVSYSQEWLSMPLGLSLLVFPGRRFSGVLWFQAGPVFKFLGLDNHHSMFHQFRDEIRGGYSLEPGGEFRLNMGNHFSLKLYGSWRRFAAKTHGESYSKFGSGDWQFLGNTSGGVYQAADLGIGLEVRF